MACCRKEASLAFGCRTLRAMWNLLSLQLILPVLL